jgi:hypothetical protein
MPTATIDKIGIDYPTLHSGTSGAYCTFVKIGERGLKLYKCRDQRDKHYRYQSELSAQSLAPAEYGCVDCELPDGSMLYAYWTEIADVAEDVHQTDWVEYDDCPVFRDLCDRLYAADYPWNDDHTGNWGYVDNGTRAVIIDTGGY